LASGYFFGSPKGDTGFFGGMNLDILFQIYLDALHQVKIPIFTYFEPPKRNSIDLLFATALYQR